MTRLPLLRFLYLLFPCSLWAQNNLSLDRIGVAQGLSQGYVTCMAQGREGFVWAGTVNGLNRFDGRGFRFFKNDPFDSLTLPNFPISAICDTSDFLLVGTSGGGLSIFHKKTERVFRVPFETARRDGAANIFSAGELGKIPGSYIINMFFDKKGSLWMVSGEMADQFCWVSRLDFPEGFWGKLPKDPNLVRHLVCKRWLSDRMDSGSKDWGYPNYLYQDRPTDGVIFNYANRPLLFNPSRQSWEDFPKPTALSGQILHIVFSKNGMGSFWHNENFEVWYFDGAQRWEKINLPGGGFVLDFNQDFVWVRTQSAVQVFKTAENVAKTDFSKPRWQFKVQDGRHVFLTDPSDNFWWAERAEGILKFNLRSTRFRHFLPGEYIGVPLCETPEGLIFWKAELDGLHFWDKKAGKKVTIGRIADFKDLANGTVAVSEPGFIWSLFGKRGSVNVILVKTNLRTGLSQRFYFPFILYQKGLLISGFNGTLWFMTDGHWVRFDTRTETWKSFRIPYPDLKKLPAFGITQTPDGAWWMATEKGLLHATPSADTFQFEVFRNNPADRNSPNNNYIACLANDTRDPFVLWLGTKGGGLNRFDIKNKRFQHFTTQEGMPDDVIYGIQPDAKGNLWLSSNHGLIRFNPTTQEIKNYLKVDGLQDFEFNTLASGAGLNGDLIFGGVNGLNIFNPDEIIDNPVKPAVQFTALKLNNLPINVGRVSNPADVLVPCDIVFLEHLTVPYSQNNITLEFAALEFTAPSKNRFRFYLEGAEQPWAHETGENLAAYLNLQPGEYVFKVIGSNSDGVWGDTPTTLKITVLPPWYRSVWAYLAYALLLGGSVLWYWRTRENRLRLELALEKKHREAEQTAWALEKEQQEAERAAREYEIARHEAEQVRAHDQQQLEEITQNLLEKNQLIAALQGQAKASQDSDALPNPEDVDALYDTRILTRKDWENFKLRFERVHPDFQQQLAKRLPDLSEAEFRLMLLLKMGLKTLEAAPILTISPESVKKAKQRLRKKLQSQDVMLEDLLNNA